MSSLIKYSFLAIKGRTYLILLTFLLSLLSYLIPRPMPDLLRLLLTAIISLLWIINAFFFVIMLLFHGHFILKLLYRQIPQKPYKIIASHLIVIFVFFTILISAWILDPRLVSSTLPYGFNIMAIANILTLSLYMASISLIILLIDFIVLPGLKQYRLIIILLALFLSVYLLVFHVTLNPIEFFMSVIEIPWEDLILATGILLQTPWSLILRNVALIAVALALQFLSLTYILNDRIDFL